MLHEPDLQPSAVRTILIIPLHESNCSFVGHLYLQDLVDFTVMIRLIEYLTKSTSFIPEISKGYQAVSSQFHCFHRYTAKRQMLQMFRPHQSVDSINHRSLHILCAIQDDDSLQSAVRLFELVGRALHAETQPAYDEWAAATAAAAAKATALPAGKTARLPSPARKNSAPAPFSVDTVLCALEAATPFVNSATR